MTRTKSEWVRLWITARWRRWQHPELARSIAQTSDKEIDTALQRAGLSRADLFTAAFAVAQHRLHMAHMLAAFEIDVEQAADRHWSELKRADGTCSGCTERGRCRRWLESGLWNDAPDIFCANAGVLSTIATEQAARHLARHSI